jgi:hypothetical protein
MNRIFFWGLSRESVGAFSAGGRFLCRLSVDAFSAGRRFMFRPFMVITAGFDVSLSMPSGFGIYPQYYIMTKENLIMLGLYKQTARTVTFCG